MKPLLVIGMIIVVIIVAYFAYSYFVTKGVKEPKYQVLKQQASISIREYEPMLIAEVTVPGERRDAINAGFRQLADYIFGNNQAQGDKKIAMTAPVMQQKSEKIPMTAPVIQTEGASGQWHVRFVMPANYTMQNLPKPNNKAIKIYQQPKSKFVLISFSGTASNNNMNKHMRLLQDYISQHNLKTTGAAVYAFYDPPWTLPNMRRNEIMFALSN